MDDECAVTVRAWGFSQVGADQLLEVALSTSIWGQGFPAPSTFPNIHHHYHYVANFP